MGLGHAGKRGVQKGVKHTLSSTRAAQIHRWQMLGAAARKGQKHAQKNAHHVQTAKAKRKVVGSYASAAKWGVAKLVVPSSLVSPVIPGWQPGDRLPGASAGRRKKRR